MSFESHNIYSNSRFILQDLESICGGNAIDGKILSDILLPSLIMIYDEW